MSGISSPKNSDSLSFERMESKPIRHIQNLKNTYIAAFSAFLYIISAGMVTAYSAPATVDMKRPGSRFIDLTSEQASWIASLPLFSSMFGNLFSSYMSQAFGRKTMLMLASSSFVTGWLMITYSPSVPWIYAGRLVSGFCSGIYCVVVPAYVAEISPIDIRGVLSSGFQLAFTSGVFLIMSFGSVLRWSWLALAGAVIPAAAACFMVFMPESPPWLVRKSKCDEALTSLKFLKGKDSDSTAELESLRYNISLQQSSGISFKELLNPSLYKPVAIAVLLVFFQQFSGINALMAYSVEIFESTKSFIQPNVAAIIVAAVQVFGTAAGSMLVDKVGRRLLYITSGICMTIALLCLGIYSFVYQRTGINGQVYGWIPLVSFVFYILMFSLGIGPIPFIVIPELVAIRSRSFVIAFASISCSFFAFLMTKVFDNMRTALGMQGVYWVYGMFSFFSAIFGYFILPETKGLSIPQIHRLFSVPKSSISE